MPMQVRFLNQPRLQVRVVNSSNALLGGAPLTKTNDTNVTLTLGGTPLTALLRATSVTAGWTGTLSVPRGGTGTSTLTSNGVLVGAGSGTVAIVTAFGGSVLAWDGAGVPSAQFNVTLGVTGSTTGTLALSGATSGVVTIRPQGAAGSYNFNLPTSAGTAGQPLLSGGGSSLAQTYGPVTTAFVLGTTTNDDAAAGYIGEYKEALGTGQSNTVTITNASPGVVTDTSHGLSIASVLNLTTTGGLPTGLSVGTNYYVSSQSFTTSTYALSTSVANALAGTSINTSSAGSGVHTRVSTGILASVTNLDVAAVSLAPGDWNVYGAIRFIPGTATINSFQSSVSTATITQPTALSEIGILGYSATIVGSTSVFAPTKRMSLAGTSTVFLVARSNFGTATVTAQGKVWARRVR